MHQQTALAVWQHINTLRVDFLAQRVILQIVAGRFQICRGAGVLLLPFPTILVHV